MVKKIGNQRGYKLTYKFKKEEQENEAFIYLTDAGFIEGEVTVFKNIRRFPLIGFKERDGIDYYQKDYKVLLDKSYTLSILPKSRLMSTYLSYYDWHSDERRKILGVLNELKPLCDVVLIYLEQSIPGGYALEPNMYIILNEKCIDTKRIIKNDSCIVPLRDQAFTVMMENCELAEVNYSSTRDKVRVNPVTNISKIVRSNCKVETLLNLHNKNGDAYYAWLLQYAIPYPYNAQQRNSMLSHVSPFTEKIIQLPYDVQWIVQKTYGFTHFNGLSWLRFDENMTYEQALKRCPKLNRETLRYMGVGDGELVTIWRKMHPGESPYA